MKHWYSMFQRCFINVSFLKIQNTMGALSRSHCVFVSLPLGFLIAPTVFLYRSHSVFVFLPLGFYFFIGQYKDETLKLKMKHSLVMFHSYNILITNAFKTENET